MDLPIRRRLARLLALSMPLIVCALQWMLWEYLRPFVWFLFYPAVFFSSRLGGKLVGITSTITSALLVYYVFIPAQLSWHIDSKTNLVSVLVFIIMGIVFSYTHDHLEQAKIREVATKNEAESARASTAEMSHAHYMMRYIIEHSRSGVAVFDNEMQYLYVSQKFLDEYRITCSDVIGKSHYEIFPEIPQRWKAIHQRVLAGEIVSEDEDTFIRQDGTIDWTRWECRPWHTADGKIGGMVLYSEVITERKRADEALKKTKNLLAEGQKIAHVGSFEYIVATKETLWSEEEFRIYGMDPGPVNHFV